MDIQETVKLLDCCWFEMEIFKNKTNPRNPSNLNHNTDQKIQQNSSRKPETASPIIATPVHRTRSKSDELSSFFEDHLSTDTVLLEPKHQSILSQKEIAEQSICIEDTVEMKSRGRRNRGRKEGKNKSLSDLEFEELKGFIDLGFVFTEEDKNSKLAEIIPGLQRFSGRKNGDGGEEEKTESDEASISRPYLSEAWESLDWKRHQDRNEFIVDWRIPVLSNEMVMKENLRWWAHTVASAIR